MSRRFLRITVLAQAAAFLIQAITAGQLLAMPGGRAAHMATAVIVVVTGVLHLVAALLVWRSDGGPARLAVSAALLLVLTLVTAALGVLHVKMLHVPLGVLLFGGSVMQITRVMPRRAPASA
ncbi:hypothetical protein [Nonomuraea rhizosphaerae]|uniref:hypothetical protein n=1 Tax=Nonomuraea rhizosphaerae TaxID=2665663 RepID=UPI001C5E754A|nr:hypothetical protein [Nonomuraea rhizosphaerae]